MFNAASEGQPPARTNYGAANAVASTIANAVVCENDRSMGLQHLTARRYLADMSADSSVAELRYLKAMT